MAVGLGYHYVVVIALTFILWKVRRAWFARHQSRPGGVIRKGPENDKEFTDYFELTGVPPPTPLPDFDIDNALPRPYRPFRWKYHQTMCMWPRFIKKLYL